MALSASTNNIDDEWSKFISNSYNNNDTDTDTTETNESNSNNGTCSNSMLYADCDNDADADTDGDYDGVTASSKTKSSFEIPEPTPIYISTKSKIAYLTDAVDLKIFWDIPVMPYATPSNGVIKKQIKFNSKTPEELNIIQEKLKSELYYDEFVMTHIENPAGRIKFKDIRKITVGISKKDIMSYRGKKKQAFYNCFVMIIRIKMNDLFREFHIKVFNTGKLEIPGVQSDEMFETVLHNIITILQPFVSTQLSYKQTSDTVLINSNFNCGFYINREVLYDLLKYKYKIHAIYDPCSYPGIQCKFHFNNDIVVQTGIQVNSENKENYKNITEVSFMIFRTGSVLIVGMCEEPVLYVIYDFLTELLKTEFHNICQNVLGVKHTMLKDKKKKIRRKTINITLLPVTTVLDALVTTDITTVLDALVTTDITDTMVALTDTMVALVALVATVATVVTTVENNNNEFIIDDKPQKPPRKKRETKPKNKTKLIIIPETNIS